MPYKDKNKQRAYQNQWMRKRRREWLAANGPCKKCGSTENLEVDHIDPKMKGTHRIWSYRKEKREVELAGCQALCKECHGKKSAEFNRFHNRAKLIRTPAFPIRNTCRSSKLVGKCASKGGVTQPQANCATP